MAETDRSPPLYVWFYTLVMLIVLCVVGSVAYVLIDDPLAYLALETRFGAAAAIIPVST